MTWPQTWEKRTTAWRQRHSPRLDPQLKWPPVVRVVRRHQEFSLVHFLHISSSSSHAASIVSSRCRHLTASIASESRGPQKETFVGAAKRKKRLGKLTRREEERKEDTSLSGKPFCSLSASSAPSAFPHETMVSRLEGSFLKIFFDRPPRPNHVFGGSRYRLCMRRISRLSTPLSCFCGVGGRMAHRRVFAAADESCLAPSSLRRNCPP